MSTKTAKKVLRRLKIRRRIRKKVSGIATKPRMSVFRSNKDIYVQLINDLEGHTIGSASSMTLTEGTKTEQAKEVGKMIATVAKDNGIETVKFDRSGYLYHGRVKALADGAREGGLKF